MEEVDLKELFDIFWSKRYLIIVVTVILGIVGIIYSNLFVTPKYTAKASMILASVSKAEGLETSITTTDVTLNNNLIATYKLLATSNSVVREVLDNLNIVDMSEGALKSKIDVTSETNTQMIYITVTDEDAYRATKITNELTDVFSEKVKEIYKIENVSVVDEAEVPMTPSNINTTRTTIIFAGIGFILSMIVIYIVSILDNTVKNAKDIEKATGLPVLAELPQCDFSEKSIKRRRN